MKKATFGSLKAGMKFKYGGKLYLKDDCDSEGCAIQLSNGAVDLDGAKINCETLVTPVRVKITIL